MPKKSHRIAAKQAQLSQRRRRDTGKPQVADTSSFASQPTEYDGKQPQRERIASVQPKVRTSPIAPGRPSIRRETRLPLANYEYLSRELKRISILSGLILVVLAVLTFFLR